MKTLYRFAALLEAVTGLALIIAPALVTRLLLGEGDSRVGLALGRVAGFALLALGIACWPDPSSTRWFAPAHRAMLTYNLLITIFLLFLGIGGELAGPSLWPAVALHAVLTIVFVGTWNRSSGLSKAF